MKFLNYLNEKDTDIDKIISLIKMDCKPYLKDLKKINKEFIYTGRYVGTDNFLKKKVRKNRRPSDTPLKLHKLMDDWFYKKFGIKARSNSVFGTWRKSIAEQYGHVYMIFPIDRYTVISSDRITDIFLHLKIIFPSFYNSNDYDKEMKDEFIDELESANYKEGLRKNRSEQMIHCKEYYLVDQELEAYIKDQLWNS